MRIAQNYLVAFAGEGNVGQGMFMPNVFPNFSREKNKLAHWKTCYCEYIIAAFKVEL